MAATHVLSCRAQWFHLDRPRAYRNLTYCICIQNYTMQPRCRQTGSCRLPRAPNTRALFVGNAYAGNAQIHRREQLKYTVRPYITPRDV